MTGDAVLGIDAGTSGIRAAMLDGDGTVLGIAGVSHARFGPNPRDPAIWEQSLRAALAALFDRVPAERVGAVSVDGTSGTVLALDGAGRPVGDAMMYNDCVADPDIPARIAAHAPRDSAAHGAASALARAIVLQDRPACRAIAHQADWIAGLLAGHPLPGDESNALKTGYDPIARDWPGWLEAAGLRPALLPRVLPVGDQTGQTAGTFGLPPGVAIIAGATDGCASFLATGAAAPGDGVTVLGTTMTLKLVSAEPVFAPEFGVYSHRIGDGWLAGGASNTGGGVLARYFSPDELTDLSAGIDTEAPQVLDYYPLIRSGERFPVADPHLAPRLTPRPDSDAEFLHAMLEAMARIEAQGYARLAALGARPVTAVRTLGGGAANPVWGAIRHRHLGVPLVAPLSDAAAVGAARIALAGVGGAGGPFGPGGAPFGRRSCLRSRALNASSGPA
ncbi:MAG: FGGY-family carbohydrate kinase [Marinibacterium sp.]